MKIKLNNPICTRIGEKVAFSRRIEKKFRLIGYGTIKKGDILAPKYDWLPLNVFYNHNKFIILFLKLFRIQLIFYLMLK